MPSYVENILVNIYHQRVVGRAIPRAIDTGGIDAIERCLELALGTDAGRATGNDDIRRFIINPHPVTRGPVRRKAVDSQLIGAFHALGYELQLPAGQVFFLATGKSQGRHRQNE